MASFGDTNHLRNLYNLGAATGMQTLRFSTIGGAPHIPVEVDITDMSGQNRGSYWMCDIDTILTEAAHKAGAQDNNPNLPIMKQIRHEMYAAKMALGHLDKEIKAPALPEEIEALFSPKL